MEISVTVETHIETGAILEKLDSAELWTYAARHWHSLYSPFVPVDTGKLVSQVEYAPKTVTHTAPYAVYQYYSAGGGWDMAAAPSRAGALAAALQEYIDAGGLGFGT